MAKAWAVLMLGSAFLFAQQAPVKGPARDANAQSSSRARYQGCVIRSGGKILLADPRGTEYTLVSSSGRELDSYVGREVRITAVDRSAADRSSSPRDVENGGPQQPPATLEVETIEKVADHCASPR